MEKFQFWAGETLHSVDVNEIIYLQVEGRKTKLVLVEGTPMFFSMTLTDCMQHLPANDFILINRATIIGLRRMTQLAHIEGSRAKVLMIDGETFEVSRRRKRELLEVLKKMTSE